MANLATKTALESDTRSGTAVPVIELQGLEVKLGGRPILKG